MHQHTIRRAVLSDAVELARLTTQLGYPTSAMEITPRLTRLLASSTDCLLIAQTSNSKLAGWIHGFLSQLLESDYRVEIGGLLVDESLRRQGIATQLLQAIENWALERGAVELSVRCREDRLEAHSFYQRLSFRYRKAQRVFRKSIAKAT